MAALERYLETNESGLHPALAWLDRETHLRTTHSRMMCGPQIGRFLTTFCELHKPKNVPRLEIIRK